MWSELSEGQQNELGSGFGPVSAEDPKPELFDHGNSESPRPCRNLLAPLRSYEIQLSTLTHNPNSPLTMPPKPRLPHLTLFTSGPQCTLCTVAKADLAALQHSVPFHLDLYDIRRPLGVDPDYSDRTAWRRLYQYDVPVLHRGAVEWGFDRLSGREGPGGRIMKHRIDKEKLAGLVRKWTEELKEEEKGN